tara:strand:- start:1540 stop:1791 length:252 start_codon:yes stop_codon:yes gene_type:complete
MIKLAEEGLRDIEDAVLPYQGTVPSIHIFRYEEYRTNHLKSEDKKISCLLFWERHWSYADCFRTIFGIGFVVGIVGFITEICI